MLPHLQQQGEAVIDRTLLRCHVMTTSLLRQYYFFITDLLTCSSRVKPLSLSHFELRSLSIARVIRSAAPPWQVGELVRR